MEKIPPALVTSAVCTLPSQIKYYIAHPKKNRLFAERLLPFYTQLCEQILPPYVSHNIDSFQVVNHVHHLLLLLKSKVYQSFHTSILRSCLDQNHALKALLQITFKLIEVLETQASEKFSQIFDRQICKQNEQSQAIATMYLSYLRDTEKKLEESDFQEVLEVYETTLHWALQDIDKHRQQRTPQQCFMTLLPWVYDCETVDLAIVMNNDLTQTICQSLSNNKAQTFWLSNFKCQTAVLADEFFWAIRELCISAHMPELYTEKSFLYEQIAFQSSVISLADDSELVSQLVKTVSKTISEVSKVNMLEAQIQLQKVVQSDLLLGGGQEPNLDLFRPLLTLKFRQSTKEQLQTKLDFVQQPFRISVGQPKSTQQLVGTITATPQDTQCNKNCQFVFEAKQSYFKFGEGDSSHFQLPNDKKLWDSQLLFTCDKEGKFWVRDCARLHPTRVRVTSEGLQVQQDMICDLGDYLQYHFDRVTQPQNQDTQLLKFWAVKAQEPDVEDYPSLRARALWTHKISPGDQQKFQREVFIDTPEDREFSVGRHSHSDIMIPLKQVANNQCLIGFSAAQGWSLKNVQGSTYVYLKSLRQIQDQAPSAAIPVKNGMVLNFANYELRINIVEAPPQTQANIQLLLPQLLKREQLMNRQDTLIAQLIAKAKASGDPAVRSKVLSKVSSGSKDTLSDSVKALSVKKETSVVKKMKTVTKKVVKKVVKPIPERLVTQTPPLVTAQSDRKTPLGKKQHEIEDLSETMKTPLEQLDQLSEASQTQIQNLLQNQALNPLENPSHKSVTGLGSVLDVKSLDFQEEEVFEEEEMEEEVEVEILDMEEQMQLEDQILADAAYVDELDLAELAADLEISQDGVFEGAQEEAPVLAMPFLNAIRADQGAATRMIVIENTTYEMPIVYNDAEDQYSERYVTPIPPTPTESQIAQRRAEEAAQRKIDQLQAQLKEALKKHQNLHQAKAKQFSDLTGAGAEQLQMSAEDAEVLIREELAQSESIAAIQAQLQNAEIHQQSLRHGLRAYVPTPTPSAKSPTSTPTPPPKTPEPQTQEMSVQTLDKIGVAKMTTQAALSLKSLQQPSYETAVGLRGQGAKAGTVTATQSRDDQHGKGWLDTDTLYSQRFLTNQQTATNRVVFPNEDEKHCPDSDNSDLD